MIAGAFAACPSARKYRFRKQQRAVYVPSAGTVLWLVSPRILIGWPSLEKADLLLSAQGDVLEDLLFTAARP
jgi:hypothetical protein